MQNEIKPQVKAPKLQFIGVGNFAQHKVYVDDHEMETMLKPSFWRAQVQGKPGDRLFPGDMLTIRQVEWKDMSRNLIKRVICRADCEVLATGPEGASIMALHVWRFDENAQIDAVQQNANDGAIAGTKGLERIWSPQARLHQVWKDRVVVYTTTDKAEADSIVAGEMDIPQAA